MTLQDFVDGLTALGFTTGYAVGNDPAEIILWENKEPQPSDSDILAASATGAKAREREVASEARRNAYVRISDPIYMQWQRGLKTEQEWLDAVAQVEADFPVPEVTN